MRNRTYNSTARMVGCSYLLLAILVTHIVVSVAKHVLGLSAVVEESQAESHPLGRAGNVTILYSPFNEEISRALLNKSQSSIQIGGRLLLKQERLTLLRSKDRLGVHLEAVHQILVHVLPNLRLGRANPNRHSASNTVFDVHGWRLSVVEEGKVQLNRMTRFQMDDLNILKRNPSTLIFVKVIDCRLEGFVCLSGAFLRGSGSILASSPCLIVLPSIASTSFRERFLGGTSGYNRRIGGTMSFRHCLTEKATVVISPTRVNMDTITPAIVATALATSARVAFGRFSCTGLCTSMLKVC